MMNILPNLAAFMLAAPDALSFKRATHRVRAVQERVLQQILRENAETRYGSRYLFSGIKSADDFCKRVPLIDYSDLSDHMEQTALGEKDVLFPGSPLCMQPTSGTTSKPKMIPFTAGLRRQYQRGVSPWNFNMNATLPSMLKGRSYWSLSPVVTEARTTAGGIPLGFLEDTGYLRPAMGYLFRKSFAVPAEVGLVQDTQLFRYITMAFLVKARNLVFVSVWNPTFFMLLLDVLSGDIHRILEDIDQGALSVLNNVPTHLRAPIAAAFRKPDPGRAEEVRSILEKEKEPSSTFYSKLWPCLRILSCWDHAEASGPADRLRRLFPAVIVQSKGLMATEGMVSLPLLDAPYPVLSVRSHFFEFIPVDDLSEVRHAWEVERDRQYEVVLTTAGGLYRYKTGDLVTVRGFYNQCPTLEFIGRGNHTSDFYGEKLHQLHVSEIINQVFQDRRPGSYAALLAPDGGATVDHYTLFIAADFTMDEKWLNATRQTFEQALRKNFHYDYCRKLGQLKQLEVCPVPGTVGMFLKRYVEEFKERGMREGDIKPSVLDNRPGWRRVLGA